MLLDDAIAKSKRLTAARITTDRRITRVTYVYHSRVGYVVYLNEDRTVNVNRSRLAEPADIQGYTDWMVAEEMNTIKIP